MVSRTIKNEIVDRQNSRCAMCGKILSPIDTHIDHKTPKKEDGTDDLDNLQALCGSCHNIKTHKDRLREQEEEEPEEEEGDEEEESDILGIKKWQKDMSNQLSDAGF